MTRLQAYLVKDSSVIRYMLLIYNILKNVALRDNAGVLNLSQVKTCESFVLALGTYYSFRRLSGISIYT